MRVYTSAGLETKRMAERTQAVGAAESPRATAQQKSFLGHEYVPPAGKQKRGTNIILCCAITRYQIDRRGEILLPTHYYYTFSASLY